MSFTTHIIIYQLIFFYHANHWITAEPIMGHNIEIAAANSLPFVVSIGHKKYRIRGEEEEAHFCGGTLITPRHVLTAAHCIDFADVRNLEVTVGSTDLRNDRNRHRVESYVSYDEYARAKCLVFGEGSGGIHDISILKLVTCVSGAVEVATITMLKNSDLYGLEAVMAGWGETDSAPVSRYLKIANTNIMSNEECKEKVEASTKCHIHKYPGKNYFCSRTDPHTLVGPGDSGGPLLINGNELIGVISKLCPSRTTFPNLAESSRVNIFVGIEHYASFINNVIGGWRHWLECTIL